MGVSHLSGSVSKFIQGQGPLLLADLTTSSSWTGESRTDFTWTNGTPVRWGFSFPGPLCSLSLTLSGHSYGYLVDGGQSLRTAGWALYLSPLAPPQSLGVWWSTANFSS